MAAGMMRAAVLHAPGTPLQIEEIPIPEPKQGEVLVKVAACGACHSDLNAMTPGSTFPMPAVLGHEVSGTVAAAGPGVAGLSTGARVVTTFIMPWR